MDNYVPQTSQNPTPQFSTKKINIFSTKWILSLSTVILLVLISFATFSIKYLNTTKIAQKNFSITPSLTPSIFPSVTNSKKEIETSQSLERNPTNKVLTQELFVHLSGETKTQNNGYTGTIEKGIAFYSDKEYKKEQEKRLQLIKSDPKASNSLFLLEVRDGNDKVLLESPIAVAIGMQGDIPTQSYQDPGYFANYILLPVNTNSIVLRKRYGEILDRVYVEDWEPEVRVTNYPKNIKLTDKFQIEIELLPSGKIYSYSLSLKNTKDDSSKGMMIEPLSQPKSGKFTETIDLNNYPFTSTDQWVIEAIGRSMFHVKSTISEPVTVNLSSENITVKISGKDKTIRKSGESDYINWTHTFYYIDVRQGLKELCAKGRCFELTWAGEGVKFNEKIGVLNPVDSVTTQIPGLECEFHGSGKQSIHLQVKENGKLIGEDTYAFSVSGTDGEPSFCMVQDY